MFCVCHFSSLNGEQIFTKFGISNTLEYDSPPQKVLISYKPVRQGYN
jgi:hypothetical protein